MALRTAGRGNPWINILDATDLPTTYEGPAVLTRLMREGAAQPRSLAAADFDEDGVPDLVSGYATPQGRLLTLH